MKSTEIGEARIFGMRHGRTQSAEKDLMRFLHEETPRHARLSQEGRAQVRKSIMEAQNQGLIDSETIIYCSDRERTLQTAADAKILLKSKRLIRTPLLNERAINIRGDIDMDELIESGIKHRPQKYVLNPISEKPFEVAARIAALIELLQREHKGRTILLVSHNDTLAIAQADINKVTFEEYSIFGFDYAEIRALHEKPHNLLRGLKKD